MIWHDMAINSPKATVFEGFLDSLDLRATHISRWSQRFCETRDARRDRRIWRLCWMLSSRSFTVFYDGGHVSFFFYVHWGKHVHKPGGWGLRIIIHKCWQLARDVLCFTNEFFVSIWNLDWCLISWQETPPPKIDESAPLQMLAWNPNSCFSAWFHFPVPNRWFVGVNNSESLVTNMDSGSATNQSGGSWSPAKQWLPTGSYDFAPLTTQKDIWLVVSSVLFQVRMSNLFDHSPKNTPWTSEQILYRGFDERCKSRYVNICKQHETTLCHIKQHYCKQH